VTTVVEPAATLVGAGGSWIRDRRSVAALAAGVAFAALSAFGWLGAARESGLTDLMRFTIVPPTEAPLQFINNPVDLAISPDGRWIVYHGPRPGGGGPQLYLRALGEFGTTSLRGTEGGLGPFISPGGEWVGFVGVGLTTLSRVSVLGGAPVPLAESPNDILGASWGEDDRIVFGTYGSGLFRVSGGGGVPEELTTLDPSQDDGGHLWPSVIDGRDAVLFSIARSGAPPLQVGRLAILDLTSGEVTRLDLEGVSPRYVPTGHLVYAASDGSVRAVPFDVGSLTVTGSTVPLLEGVSVKNSGAANFDVSDDGRLVYTLGGPGGGIERALLWVDRDGREEPIEAPLETYTYARLSPDDRRLAIDTRGDADDIWIWDFANQTPTRMILGNGGYSYPVWTPDGSRIAYNTGEDFFWKASNNAGDPSLLVDDPGREFGGGPSPYFFSPDGSALVYRDQTPETAEDLVMIPIEGDPSPVWRIDSPFAERNASLSPGGRWMAYQSDESGQFEVYVRPFPDVDTDVVRVSNAGGADPVWSRDGGELFYLQPGVTPQLISVALPGGEPEVTFTFGGREALMDWPFYTGGQGRNYDVARDGRFVVIDASGGGSEGVVSEIAVVLNWFEELRERMGES
jgi:serine/threonine-protein kinase